MPLQIAAPPDAVLAEYRQSLADFLGPHDPEVTLYHLPVGTLGLQDLQSGATFADIVPAGSRILASWPNGTWTSCEMTNPMENGPARFRSFMQGDLVATMFKRITEAQGMAAVLSGAFDLHFLAIPGVRVEALHLVSSVQNQDLILPVLSEDSQLATQAVQQAEGLLASILTEAPQLTTEAVLGEEVFLAIVRLVASVRLALPSSSDLSS